MPDAPPCSTKVGLLGALFVAGLLLGSCASPETEAPDVNITPVTQAPSDPEAGSSQDDVETEATQVTHIDFTVLDMGDVADVPGAMTDGVTEESVVSYEENRQLLLSFGFVEVETSTS